MCFAPYCVCLLVFPFNLEVWPVLGWRVSGMDCWKDRVLSSGGLRGWGFMAGGDLAGCQRSYCRICYVHCLGGCFW